MQVSTQSAHKADLGISHSEHTFETANGPRTIVIDYGSRLASVDGEGLVLTSSAFSLLALLAQRAGKVCTRRMIWAYLHKEAPYRESKVNDVFICILRRELRRFGISCIETMYGRGYCFGTPYLPPCRARPIPTVTSVRGHQGALLSFQDLPTYKLAHWYPYQKANLVLIVNGGMITVEDAIRMYPGFSKEEFAEWSELYASGGLQALSA